MVFLLILICLLKTDFPNTDQASLKVGVFLHLDSESLPRWDFVTMALEVNIIIIWAEGHRAQLSIVMVWAEGHRA